MLADKKEVSGRWDKAEHQRFLEGNKITISFIALRIYGKNWKKVEEHVKTRSGPQIRSHAQKYFQKVEHTPASKAGHRGDSQSDDSRPAGEEPPAKVCGGDDECCPATKRPHAREERKAKVSPPQESVARKLRYSFQRDPPMLEEPGEESSEPSACPFLKYFLYVPR